MDQADLISLIQEIKLKVEEVKGKLDSLDENATDIQQREYVERGYLNGQSFAYNYVIKLLQSKQISLSVQEYIDMNSNGSAEFDIKIDGVSIIKNLTFRDYSEQILKKLDKNTANFTNNNIEITSNKWSPFSDDLIYYPNTITINGSKLKIDNGINLLCDESGPDEVKIYYISVDFHNSPQTINAFPADDALIKDIRINEFKLP